MRNIKSKGLAVYIKDSEEAQMYIKMFAKLTLLPANLIEQGYHFIIAFVKKQESIICS